MRDIDELSIRNGTPESSSGLNVVEEIIGRRLPVGLKVIMQEHSGGSPEIGVFDFEGETTAISDFLRFTGELDDPLGVVCLMRKIPNLPSHVVPFARDAGDWLVCLDYSGDGTPAVIVYVPEDGRSIFVSESFEAFIDSLHE